MTGVRAASAPRPGLALVVSAAEAWTRRPGETSTAYAAFCAYRDLGPSRSLAEAYRQRTGKASRGELDELVPAERMEI